MDLIYIIIFLIVLLILNSILSPIMVKEYFVNDEALPIKLFNSMGRNLSFPYFGNNNIFTASQRAKIDPNKVITYPNGKCKLNNSLLNNSYAIVTEDLLLYNLIKSCMALNIKKYRFENNKNTLIISFDIALAQNLENISKFLLINPLFIEFNFGNTSSIAYVINTNPIYFSNALDIPFNKYISHTNTSYIELKFDIAVPLASGDCDNSFNYQTFSSNQNIVTDDQMNIALKDGLLNIWVYYLDELTDNHQYIGRTLPINNNNETITLFKKNYIDISNDPYMVSTYEFMNNIALMYYNFIMPVFTISFDIIITNDMFQGIKNNIQELMKCSMTNNFGGTSGCQNNIFAVRLYPWRTQGIETEEDTNNSVIYTLAILTGDDNNCGFNTHNSPVLWLQLPWLNPNNRIRITLTIGPNQKYAYAQWLDINKGNIGKQIVYAKTITNFVNSPSDICNYPDFNISNTNNLTRLFTSKTLNPRPPLEDINLYSNKKFVTNINSFSLGYINFNNNFADK